MGPGPPRPERRTRRVPDVAPGPVESGSFVSRARGGCGPAGRSRGHRVAQASSRCSSCFMASAATTAPRWARTSGSTASWPTSAPGCRRSRSPRSTAGRRYWHRRPGGEDAGAMVLDEFVPLLAKHGLAHRPGRPDGLVDGWVRRPPARRASSVRVAVPSWSPRARRSGRDGERPRDPGSATPRSTPSSASSATRTSSTGIPVRIDCGTGDPFYRATQSYVDGFPRRLTGPARRLPAGRPRDGLLAADGPRSSCASWDSTSST